MDVEFVACLFQIKCVIFRARSAVYFSETLKVPCTNDARIGESEQNPKDSHAQRMDC